MYCTGVEVTLKPPIFLAIRRRCSCGVSSSVVSLVDRRLVGSAALRSSISSASIRNCFAVCIFEADTDSGVLQFFY